MAKSLFDGFVFNHRLKFVFDVASEPKRAKAALA